MTRKVFFSVAKIPAKTGGPADRQPGHKKKSNQWGGRLDASQPATTQFAVIHSNGEISLLQPIVVLSVQAAGVYKVDQTLPRYLEYSFTV